MGIIRSVEDKNLNRTLAMKILSPKYVHDGSIFDAFLEEASLTAQLQHPNIIPVHDIGILPETGHHFYHHDAGRWRFSSGRYRPTKKTKS